MAQYRASLHHTGWYKQLPLRVKVEMKSACQMVSVTCEDHKLAAPHFVILPVVLNGVLVNLFQNFYPLSEKGKNKKKKYLRTALFWAVTQHVVIIPYPRFGTTYWFHLHGSRIQGVSWILDV